MDKAKRQRTLCLSNFTRNLNVLNKLIDDSAPETLVTPQYEKLKECWGLLELAHNQFIGETDIVDIETDKDGLPYIDAPIEKYTGVLKR